MSDRNGLTQFARNELAKLDEWRVYCPDYDGPYGEDLLAADVLERFISDTMPVSVQYAMARAARLLYQRAMERNGRAQ